MLFAENSTDNMSVKTAQRNKDPRSVAQQLRDVAIYFAIGVPFVFGVLFEAEHTSGEPWLGVQWSIFAGLTAFLFGIAINERRRHWSKPRFWLYVTALL